MSSLHVGSHSRYVHGCRCPDCTTAHTERCRRDRASRSVEGLPADDPRHGKSSTYRNWSCRCAACSNAHRAECASYWQRRRAGAS